MEFNNYTQDPQRFPVLENGTYEAQVASYKYGTSQNGNEQIVLTLRVYHEDEEFSVMDWLPNTPGSQWKVKMFTEAVGQTYERGGSLDMEKALNKLFKVVVVKKPRKDQPGQHQNNIEGYFPIGKKESVPADALEDVF